MKSSDKTVMILCFLFQNHQLKKCDAHLEVVQQTARCGHQDVDAVGQFLGLSWAVAAPHDQTVGVHVVLHQLLHHTVRLHRQLTRGCKDHDTGTWEDAEKDL